MRPSIYRFRFLLLLISVVALISSVIAFIPTAAADSSMETAFLAILNPQRVAAGLNALTVNTSLETAAYLHSQDMAVNQYFSHTSQDGTTFDQRIVAAGYTNYSTLGENLAAYYGAPDAQYLFDMWKNSPGHNANMFGNYKEAGLGVYTYEGFTYCTLDLGSRSGYVQPSADYSISAATATQSVVQGNAVSYNLSILPVNGFIGSVVLSASGLPTGAGCTFSPNPTYGSAILNVTTSSGTPVGAYTITVGGASGTLVRTTTITLAVTSNRVSQTAVKLAFSTSPALAVAGLPFNTQPVVEIEDTQGNPVTNTSIPVTLQIHNQNGAVLSGTTTVNSINGYATFSGLSVNQAGTGYTLTASGGSLPPCTSNAFDTVNPPTVSLGIITNQTCSNGIVGVDYSLPLSAVGGVPPYSWSIQTGSMPLGLSLDPATGIISGTPTSATNPVSFTVKVTDSVGSTFCKVLTMGITTGPVITSNILDDGRVGSPYYEKLSGAGGTLPYIWGIVSGGLPAGLSIDASSGIISGTPVNKGQNSFSVRLTDHNGRNVRQSFTISVSSGPSIIVSGTMPQAEAGVKFDQFLNVSGGVSPCVWAITSGSLPSGLTLNTATGEISGITSTPSGTFTFTTGVTDATGAQGTIDLAITVIDSLSITTAGLPNAEPDVAYLCNLTVSGGASPYAWSVISGALPQGLSLDNTAGTISGTPESIGTTSSFGIKVQDAAGGFSTKLFSISVQPQSLVISTVAVPPGQANEAYSAALAVSGGTGPYIWSIISGALPSGITLDSLTGVLQGVPSCGAGSYSFTVLVSDTEKNTAQQNFTIPISTDVVITTPANLPNAISGVAYCQQLGFSGGVAPCTWSVVSGKMPIGLSLDASSGEIEGIPTVATSTVTFTIMVTDAAGSHDTQTFAMGVTAGPVIITSNLPNGAPGIPYAVQMTGAGGSGSYTWSVQSGNLPPGLVLDSKSGNISGRPLNAGSFSFVIKILDRNGRTASKSLTIPITGQ